MQNDLTGAYCLKQSKKVWIAKYLGIMLLQNTVTSSCNIPADLNCQVMDVSFHNPPIIWFIAVCSEQLTGS
jgi:hypothetical protein